MRGTEDVVDSRGRNRSESWTVNDEDSLTIQSQRDLADIGKILGKYAQVGVVDHLNKAEATFMDVSEFSDYADLMVQTKVAEAEFMKLPSKVREIFGHSVENWLDAAHDPEKRDDLVRAGFIEAPVKPEAPVVVVKPEAPVVVAAKPVDVVPVVDE